MRVTFSNLDELYAMKKSLDKLKGSYPILFEKLVHIVNLTRALQFKYQFMGSLLMDEDPGMYSPKFVQGSVLRLYKKEVQRIKDDLDFRVLKQTLADYKDTSYAKFSLLVIGKTPESLLGAPIIK